MTSIAVGSLVLVVLSVAALLILANQPDAPVADFPPPGDREEAWRQDIAYLRDGFSRVDRSFTPEQLKAFRDALSGLHDRVPSMPDERIVVEITRAVAGSDNAHTRTYLMRNDNHLRRLPVRFYWFSDGLFIVRATTDYPQTLGTRVVAINGTTPEALMHQIRELVPGSDNWAVYKSTYFLNSPELLHGLNVVLSATSVPLTLKKPDGTIITLELPALPLDPRERPYEAWRDLSPLSTGNADGREWLHVLGDHQLPVYLQQPNLSCSDQSWPEAPLIYIQINRNQSDETCSFSEFEDRIEELSRSVKPEAVIVDLRFDTGGDYTQTARLARALPDWFNSAERIYVLTGPATFSAGIVTAARLKHFSDGRAVIAGEAAGDGLQGWSEGPTCTLPNSGLKVKAATAFHDFAEARFEFGKTYFIDLFYSAPAGDIDVDLPVTVSFEDYLSGADPVLEAIASRHPYQP